MECNTFSYENVTYRFAEFKPKENSDIKVLVGEQSLWKALTNKDGDPKDEYAEKLIDIFYAFLDDFMFNKSKDVIQQEVYKLR